MRRLSVCLLDTSSNGETHPIRIPSNRYLAFLYAPNPENPEPKRSIRSVTF
uniref:Uncharacterized protein n=1 Tax=Candidatus Kentrum sp. MB TaxID=2138164 RepID=A0A451BF96_9GAMM|nr:MAG: hypothetical protein BECKMB1821G_GA0114241_108012 [Candidatus Kentron sp. MB]VFK34791.1 MAG: hypothetical protein BECKMB1821I_GA0114274_108413 [Candidatus Kentron sp. MB]VFK76950.1 MAG: hypothetical protein BECKMB1821H_GA0114242_108513 [Candidatus Kentron sp. MB]